MLWIFLLFQLAYAGNVLVLNPTLGHSHVRFLGNLAELLVEDGHNVTILTTVIDDSVKPFGTSHPKIHKILYKSPYVNVSGFDDLEMKGPQLWDLPEPDGIATDIEVWDVFIVSYYAMYKGLLEDKELMQQLKDSKFDLGITELYDLSCMGYFELLGIKSAIVATALGMTGIHYDISGLPDFPSFVPGWAMTYSEHMSFWQRFTNAQTNLIISYSEYADVTRHQELFNEYYPGFPNLVDLTAAKTGVILSNANEFTESPRPTSNMFQYVGGTNVHPPKPLNKEMDDILKLRPSTVLFSFGSFTKGCHLPATLKSELLDAFSSFPDVTFLWKYENCENDTTSFSDYPNVVPKPWLPQTDLLGDPRLKAFITHAGMNSMLEVAFRGKPTISIPLFADQYINARNAESRGISILLKRSELSGSTMKAALEKVLDPLSTVSKKASIAAAVLKGKDEEYRNAVRRWANLLIEFGPLEHVRLPSRNLNFLQRYCVDIIAFVVIVPLVSLVIVYYFLKYLLFSLFGANVAKKSEKKYKKL